VRILHTSDWHLGRAIEGRDRHREQEDFIDEICTIADDEKIDLVLVAGDIFDTYNPPAISELLFCDALERLSKRGERAVVVIAGNHDNPERLCSVLPLALHYGIFLIGYPKSHIQPFKTDGRVSCVSSGQGWIEVSIPKCLHNAVILTLPYPSEARLKEVLSDLMDDKAFQGAYTEKIKEILSYRIQNFRHDTVNLLVSHLLTLGGQTSESERVLGGAYLVESSSFPSSIQYAALGHLHRPQKVNYDVPIYYSGSPLAYSFSEANQSKSVFIVDVKPGEKPQVNKIYLTSGKPLVKWKATEGINQVLKWCEEGKNSDAWIEIDVYIEQALDHSQIATIRKAHPGVLNVRPIFLGEEKIKMQLSRTSIPIDEAFKDFYMKKTAGSKPSQELIDLFLELY
jgi:exonuclease SbcD